MLVSACSAAGVSGRQAGGLAGASEVEGSAHAGLEERLDHLMLAIGHGSHKRRHARPVWEERPMVCRHCTYAIWRAATQRRVPQQLARTNWKSGSSTRERLALMAARTALYWQAGAPLEGSHHGRVAIAACAGAMCRLGDSCHMGPDGPTSFSSLGWVDLSAMLICDGLLPSMALSRSLAAARGSSDRKHARREGPTYDDEARAETAIFLLNCRCI